MPCPEPRGGNATALQSRWQIPNAQAPKAVARKSRIAPKAGHPRSTSTANLETEVARLARERDEALEQQTATSEVLSIIRRSPADAQPVFDAIVQSAARLCGAIFSAVYLYEDDHVHIAATNNFSPEAARRAVELREQKRPDRSHLGGRAILDRAIVHVPDVLNDPEYSREWALAGGWRAVLAVPLLRDGKPVGAVTVAKAEPKPFSDRQVQLLNSFADQALIAIENVRLFEAEQQRTRELSSRWSSRRPRPKSSKSSADRRSTYKKCSTHWSNQPPGYAKPIWLSSIASRAPSLNPWQPMG